MRLLRVGEGVPLGGESGHVVAVFPRAVYVCVPGGLFALVGPDVEPGPLHAHVTRLPVAAVGDPVRVAGDRLYLGGRPVPGGLLGPQGEASRAGLAARPAVWRAPPLPDPGRADEIARTLRLVLDHEPDFNLGAAGPSIPDDLGDAATALAGRGAA